MLNDLSMYKNRQTIINEYYEEELIERSGFIFDEMKTDNNSIQFLRDGILLKRMELPVHSTSRKDNSFPNFYVLEWELTRIEIYFP
jgi:hypothetical protein